MTISATRLALPLPWGGLVYPTLIQRGKTRVLIDCGHSSKASRAALLKALKGKAPDLLIITHAHQDHYGGLPALLDAYPDLPVYAARCAQPYYEDQQRTVMQHHAHLKAFSQRMGLNEAISKQVLSGFEKIANSGCGTSLARLLDDGDRLDIDGIELRVHHHPGHHHHHLVLQLPQSGQLITGDNIFATHLTPPQVRFGDDGQRLADLPLLLESLQKLADIGGHALPSHGEELPDVRSVALNSKAAYERTAERVRKAMATHQNAPKLEELLSQVFGNVPVDFIGLRLGFLLGYADWVGAGENYR